MHYILTTSHTFTNHPLFPLSVSHPHNMSRTMDNYIPPNLFPDNGSLAESESSLQGGDSSMGEFFLLILASNGSAGRLIIYRAKFRRRYSRCSPICKASDYRKLEFECVCLQRKPSYILSILCLTVVIYAGFTPLTSERHRADKGT